MDEMKRRGFRVMEGEGTFDEEQHKQHRIILIIILLIIVAAVVGAILLYRWEKGRSYNQYEVLETQNIEPVSDAVFYDFKGSVLKVSRNGAIYSKPSGELIWNQSFQMNAPIVDICQEYVSISAQNGNEIYILDTSGLKGKVETPRKIRAVEVAAQGTVAVMSEKKNSYFVNLYSAQGEELVRGEMHLENSGYPLSMSLSADGIKLAVALVDVSTGQANTTMNFYNFGTVGQNEIDNLVQSYRYPNVIIPKIHYFDDEKVVAVADDRLIFYKGSQKPSETDQISLSEPVRKVFFSDKYMGITYNEEKKSEDKNQAVEYQHKLVLYDAKGKEVFQQAYQEDYTRVSIIADNHLILTRENLCRVYSMEGVLKYGGSLTDAILNIHPASAGNEYYILYRDKIEKIKFK